MKVLNLVLSLITVVASSSVVLNTSVQAAPLLSSNLIAQWSMTDTTISAINNHYDTMSSNNKNVVDRGIVQLQEASNRFKSSNDKVTFRSEVLAVFSSAKAQIKSNKADFFINANSELRTLRTQRDLPSNTASVIKNHISQIKANIAIQEKQLFSDMKVGLNNVLSR